MVTHVRSSATSPKLGFTTGFVAFLLGLAGLACLFLIGNSVYGAVAGGREVSFKGMVQTRAIGSTPPTGVVVDSPGVVDASVHIEDAGPRQHMLALGRDLLPTILVTAGLWLLVGLLQSTREGDPFTRGNVRRLRVLGLLLLCLPVVTAIRHTIDNALAGSIPGLTNWPNGDGLSLNGPMASIVVFALAEIFAHGVDLREDIEGTV